MATSMYAVPDEAQPLYAAFRAPAKPLRQSTGALKRLHSADDEPMSIAKSSSPPEISDEELFTKIREERSEAAFNTLYKRYDKRLYAYCLRATGSHDAAKDAFQAVMSVVFEKRESFTGGNYAAWLFTIARHHVMKVSKRQQRDLTQNKPIDEEFDDVTPDRGGGVNEHHDFLLQQALDRAIAQLPEDLREAFELKQYDGLQHEEIAQTLGITVSLAKVRVFRAKQQLRQLLAPFIKELQ
ncbi:MAG: sigma-70 family RNA polymerase sigma factor [Candidatus Kapabacteria bacterium]|nr:sigma-70 family RNA polymerase sigma factor [Candidatus Kapabacteria bacterium]